MHVIPLSLPLSIGHSAVLFVSKFSFWLKKIDALFATARISSCFFHQIFNISFFSRHVLNSVSFLWRVCV